jgi:hypothetical protein
MEVRPVASLPHAPVIVESAVAELRTGAPIEDICLFFDIAPVELAVAIICWLRDAVASGVIFDSEHAEICALLAHALDPR